MPWKIEGKLDGLALALQSLKGLKQTVRGKITRQALQAGTRPIQAQAKARAPQETGLFRRSLGRKVKTYRASGTVVALVGPRTKFRQLVTVGRRQVYRNPSKYGHLLEYGHRIVKGGRDVGRVQAYPSLGPAFEAAKAQAVQIIAAKVAEGLAKVKR